MSTASKPASKRYAKFCAYCKAKGLSEAEFTSHFVKDAPGPKGKVCCPELLKNECGYCHEIGHTPKHCPKLKDARRAAPQGEGGRDPPGEGADGVQGGERAGAGRRAAAVQELLRGARRVAGAAAAAPRAGAAPPAPGRARCRAR